MGLERFRVGGFGQRGLLGEQLIDRLDTGAGQAQLALQAAEILHRRIQAEDGDEEGEQVSRRAPGRGR